MRFTEKLFPPLAISFRLAELLAGKLSSPSPITAESSGEVAVSVLSVIVQKSRHNSVLYEE